nr:metallophosphoesterase [uncultured Roseovarius sp.]
MVKWYTADPHFGHENILKFCKRPFKNTDEMDNAIIRNLWSCVQPEDELWILGDFAAPRGANSPTWLMSIFEKLPGKSRHFVTGNHDREAVLQLPWDSVNSLVEVQDGPKNQKHTLCHYPLLTWNHSRRGALNLFGHVHDNWKGSRNSINVGVDVWDFMPVRFEDIARRAQTLPVNAHWHDVEPQSPL